MPKLECHEVDKFGNDGGRPQGAGLALGWSSTCLVSNGLSVPPDKSGYERIHGDASRPELLGEART